MWKLVDSLSANFTSFNYIYIDDDSLHRVNQIYEGEIM